MLAPVPLPAIISPTAQLPPTPTTPPSPLGVRDVMHPFLLACLPATPLPCPALPLPRVCRLSPSPRSLILPLSVVTHHQTPLSARGPLQLTPHRTPNPLPNPTPRPACVRTPKLTPLLPKRRNSFGNEKKWTNVLMSGSPGGGEWGCRRRGRCRWSVGPEGNGNGRDGGFPGGSWDGPGAFGAPKGGNFLEVGGC